MLPVWYYVRSDTDFVVCLVGVNHHAHYACTDLYNLLMSVHAAHARPHLHDRPHVPAVQVVTISEQS